MSITHFLNSRGFHSFEGYSQQVPNQVEDLIKLLNGSNIHVMEIGFNAGHSADVFLQNNPTLTLTSFDLGYHKYVNTAKEYIDATYPNRHSLILGDSTVTVPKYINDNPDKVFDIIFIDGGHDYKIANADLENCMKLANKNTIVIMDDTMYRSEWEASWTRGPTKTWIEHLNNGTITEINRVDYSKGRGMSWGKYVLL
jgi:predicted O-methyltransferase YrrM